MTEPRAPRGQAWYDEDAGPLVRPYALTHGRTRSARPELDLITMVGLGGPPPDPHTVAPEYAQILDLCRYPQSVAEIASALRLPLVVVKVLIGDLIEEQYLIHRTTEWTMSLPDRNTIQAVLNGLRAL